MPAQTSASFQKLDPETVCRWSPCAPGTSGYIAPEVYAYGNTKARVGYGIPADIWSTGATLYQVSALHSTPLIQVFDACTCPIHALQQQA